MVECDEVFYKICFDSLIEGLCIANEEGRIVMNNSALEEIFGYGKGELLGKKIDVLIPVTHRSLHFYHYKQYVKSPKIYKRGKGREFFGLHKNGDILDLEIGLNYFDHEGAFYAKALISEISTRKQKEFRIKEKNRNLEREVEKSTTRLLKVVSALETSNLKLKEEIKDRIIAENRAKIAFEKEKELNFMQTKFISLASHEFKTPLSGILTSAGLIERYNDTILDKRISKHVETIKTLVSQLNNILDDFLYLENAESKTYSFQISRFKFCDVINDLVKDANAILKEGQKIEIQTCKSAVEIWQDRKVLDIIIRNVLYNAIKYSDKHQVIKVKIQGKENLTIIIQDEGIGIPKESQKLVFDRFYRAKNALPTPGTGIGLNIVKRHLEKLHGSIVIESEENKGTKVIIKLPLYVKK